ncbi:WXG100 family type VII secretion target [Humibacillus xanthopallidus]|uniref:WXG100 family type VII secretion target n=1 Tax=Humibacillus xanthopallidus TaxID=412689 RepID=UPI00384EE134
MAEVVEEEAAMLYRKGGDPEVLDRVAGELATCAREVESVRAAGTEALAVIRRSWGGADSDAVQAEWRRSAVALTTLTTSLETLSVRLRENARAQRTASTMATAAPALLPSAVPGSAGLFPDLGGAGSAGTGVVDEPSIADDTRGTTPQDIDLELAELAAGVYDGEGSEHFDPVSDAELMALGIDPGSLEGPGGFQAGIYRDADGGYVLAFAGTDPASVEDWGTNLQQGVGALSGQHGQAIGLAEQLSRAVGSDNVVLTGHSLGGGLASTASVATDLPAVTFNAAGVHPNTVVAAALVGQESPVIAPDQVRNYHVRGEVLTTLQHPLGSFTDHVPLIGDNILPNALGTQIALDPARGPEIEVSPWDLTNPVGFVVDTAIDIGRYSVDQHGTPSVLDAMEASDHFGRR